MLRFDPPENATYAEKQPSEGWISCGWQLLDTWKGARGYREIAKDLGCSAGLLTTWKQGKTPVKTYLEKLEKLADIAPIAWQYWVCLDPSKATADNPPPSDPPPSSGSRSVEGIKLGSHAHELRASVARLTALLAKGKLSPAQVATLEGKRITALCALARLEPMALHEHPDFERFFDVILDAMKTLPGGIKTMLAALQQFKNASQENAA